MTELETLVASLSDNFSKIIPRDVISKHPIIDWGGNGLGGSLGQKKIQLYGCSFLYDQMLLRER